MADNVTITDVAQVEQFANRLDRLRQQLEQVSRELQSAVDAVRPYWKDPQADKLAAEVKEMSKVVRRFADSTQQPITYCRKLTQHIRSTPRR